MWIVEAAGDPDGGVPVGIPTRCRELPTSSRSSYGGLDNQPREPGLQWVPNYSSVEENVEFAKAKFEEDAAEGMMIKMSLRDFKARYGEHRAIAALAVIVEDETVGKKRMIHDATHGVRVNHRIRCRDKIRAPGAKEKKQLLREMMEAKLPGLSDRR